MTRGLLPALGEFTAAVEPQLRDIAELAMIHDDSIVAGCDQIDHDHGVRAAGLGLTLNESKCVFGASEVPFWGFIVSRDSIKPDHLKVKTLQQQKRPQTKEELISYLAMVRAKSDFVPNIAKETSTLRNLTKKGVHFKWTDEHEVEFEKVKKLFNEHVLLHYYDPNLPTYIFVDASINGFGAILYQGKSQDLCHSVTVASRATTEVESRYPQKDLEAMAIDFALRRFRYYIVGGPQITVITDHKPLIAIFNNIRTGSTRIQRIKLRSQDINYNVQYQKGCDNMSDYFSRHAIPLEQLSEEIREETNENSKLLYSLTVCPCTSTIPKELLIKETNKDEVLRRLLHAIYLGYCPNDDDQLKPYGKIFSQLSVSDDDGILRESRTILPKSLQEMAIDQAHQGGHPEMARLKSKIRSYYWFPDLDRVVEEWVRSCECQLFTLDKTQNPITSAPTPDAPWNNVSVDLFGPMPKDEHILVIRDDLSRYPKDEHILVIRDNLSRCPAASVVHSTAAKRVIPAMDNIYSTLGNPIEHKTDSGPPFNGNEFDNYSMRNNIKHKRTPPFHPQSNEAECFMKPLGYEVSPSQ